MKALHALMTVLAAAVSGAVCAAQAQGGAPVVMQTVTVGNPGNAGDPQQFQGIFGGVDYVYAVGKYEVTAGQYAAFLDAVAATDTYGLYNPNMWTHEAGCKIERTGSPGSYSYSVAPDWATSSPGAPRHASPTGCTTGNPPARRIRPPPRTARIS
jgi:hypothetical protein